MDGFQRRGEQKKLDILEAALLLFMNHGIQKFSISDIAKKANVSQVTIYNYFESKHKLIQDVFIFYLEKASLDFEKVVQSPLPFLEKIKKLVFDQKNLANTIHE